MTSPASIVPKTLRLRCPRCGLGRLYQRWNVLCEHCPSCGLDIQRREQEAWFFIYMSTAGLTGIVILPMLFIDLTSIVFGYAVALLGWLLLILLTLPARKALAIGIDYYLEERLRNSISPLHKSDGIDINDQSD